jgi:anaerobic selenocysteine-containing dehydrogenase
MANFGADGPVASYVDIDQAELLCLYGHNVAQAQTVLWERMLAAKACNGGRITVLQGFYQGVEATASSSLVNSAQLLTDALGKPGAGPLLMAGQSSAMSNREAGADRQPAHHLCPRPGEPAASVQFLACGAAAPELRTAATLADRAAARFAEPGYAALCGAEDSLMWSVCPQPRFGAADAGRGMGDAGPCGGGRRSDAAQMPSSSASFCVETAPLCVTTRSEFSLRPAM